MSAQQETRRQRVPSCVWLLILAPLAAVALLSFVFAPVLAAGLIVVGFVGYRGSRDTTTRAIAAGAAAAGIVLLIVLVLLVTLGFATGSGSEVSSGPVYVQ